jgi:hypothetical protein
MSGVRAEPRGGAASAGAGVERERGEAMTKLNDDDLVTWTFNGQHTACTVQVAREMLRAAYPDWSDEQIEQELFARIEIERLPVYFNLIRDAVSWADAHEVERKLGHTPQWLVHARAALAKAWGANERR